MTKRIAMALVLVFGATGAVSAQSVQASARVPNIAAFTGTPQALIFPVATPGGTGGANVTGGMTAANAAGQLGFNDVRLNYAAPTVSMPATLTLASTATPANQISATISCGIGATNAASVTLADCSSPTSLGHTGNGVLVRRVFVGGSISQTAIDAAVPANDYTGTITVTLVAP